MDYLKIGKASDLEGNDRRLYRLFEILPGALSWLTLFLLIALSYFKPVWVACFIIAFDVYWLLLVIYLAIHLLASYRTLIQNSKIDWKSRCLAVKQDEITADSIKSWEDVIHLVFLPTYNESVDVVRPTVEAIANENYPSDRMVIVYAVEERGGDAAQQTAKKMKEEFGGRFKDFVIITHPADIPDELKGKGANQAWAAKRIKEQLVDKEGMNYDQILVSVFDIDTVISPGYFYCLTYKFLTSPNPYRASYQPVPMYHNNIWQAPFFARVAASSNTFWQMMQQIRQEKLATYSSHSMTWRALVDIGFWSTKMVSEDSRIFWHCFCYYKGDYRVEPMNFPVSMDVCMDESFMQTARNLYKQQRRWGWGVENLPYLLFNAIKNRKEIPKKVMASKIFIQLYGFHSWATNALIIGVIGWLPMLLGGDRFNSTVLSGNLPFVTRTLMTIAMGGMVISAIISTLLLPPRPEKYGFLKSVAMFLQWAVLPVSIIIFGAIPGLESQTRLMMGKYMGFWVTPKAR